MKAIAIVLAAATVTGCTVTQSQPEELPPINTEPVVQVRPLPVTTMPLSTTTTTTDPLAAVDWEALEVAARDAARTKYGRCGEWREPALAAGFSPDEWLTLQHIIGRETGNTCDERAHNDNVKTGDDSYGLTQINLIGKLWPDRARLCGLSAPTDLLHGETNLRCAHKIYERSGWAPWRM